MFGHIRIHVHTYIVPIHACTACVDNQLVHGTYVHSSVQMKWWYRILNVVAILLKILGMALWIVQAGYSATQGQTHFLCLSL